MLPIWGGLQDAGCPLVKPHEMDADGYRDHFGIPSTPGLSGMLTHSRFSATRGHLEGSETASSPPQEGADIYPEGQGLVQSINFQLLG